MTLPGDPGDLVRWINLGADLCEGLARCDALARCECDALDCCERICPFMSAYSLPRTLLLRCNQELAVGPRKSKADWAGGGYHGGGGAKRASIAMPSAAA